MTIEVHPLLIDVLGDPHKLPFEKYNITMEGWYIWRLDPKWSKFDYKCIEIANGAMMDTEAGDEDGTCDIVKECKPYGEFFGPILLR